MEEACGSHHDVVREAELVAHATNFHLPVPLQRAFLFHLHSRVARRRAYAPVPEFPAGETAAPPPKQHSSARTPATAQRTDSGWNCTRLRGFFAGVGMPISAARGCFEQHRNQHVSEAAPRTQHAQEATLTVFIYHLALLPRRRGRHQIHVTLVRVGRRRGRGPSTWGSRGGPACARCSRRRRHARPRCSSHPSASAGLGGGSGRAATRGRYFYQVRKS